MSRSKRFHIPMDLTIIRASYATRVVGVLSCYVAVRARVRDRSRSSVQPCRNRPHPLRPPYVDVWQRLTSTRLGGRYDTDRIELGRPTPALEPHS